MTNKIEAIIAADNKYKDAIKVMRNGHEAMLNIFIAINVKAAIDEYRDKVSLTLEHLDRPEPKYVIPTPTIFTTPAAFMEDVVDPVGVIYTLNNNAGYFD